MGLDFFKNYAFTHSGNQIKLFDACQKLIDSSEKSRTFIINNVPYTLSVIKDGPKYQVKFARSMGDQGQSVVKPLIEYKDEEVLSLLTDQQFVIEKKGVEYHLSNIIRNSIEIGGLVRLICTVPIS